MADILIIDDDRDMSFTLWHMVSEIGHQPTAAYSLEEGLEKARAGDFDIVFLDVRLPDGNGLDLIPHLQAIPFPPEIVIITAYSEMDGAEMALKSGVWDYIQKPCRYDDIRLLMDRALQYREQKKASKTKLVINRAGIVGNSRQILACIDLMAQAACSEANVLLSGETGTGKEVFANAIHQNSARSDKKFVIVDCAALPEHLIESVLFGHAKGAFTGADEAQQGLIRHADGGTLFLDEVGELSFNLQKTFLRVLQEHRFRPIGRKKEVDSNFRLISATNRNLDQMVEKGLFRQDLLHRIRALAIELPPLRQRREDIRELVLYFMAKLCEKYNIGLKGFSPECFDMLAHYNFPGNVRELVNTLESALSSAFGEPTLFPKHLPPHIRIKTKIPSINSGDPAVQDTPVEAVSSVKERLKLQDLIEDTRRKYLQELMDETGGDIKKVCQISGLSRSSLYENLNRYKIPTSW